MLYWMQDENRAKSRLHPIGHNNLGAKWTALILRDLMDGPKRFCELQRLVAGINPRTLTARLLELEDRGIVTNDGTTGYAPTPKGKDLLPIPKNKWPPGATNTTNPARIFSS